MIGFSFFNRYKLIKGVLHIGAHLCEEEEEYNKLGVKNENIIWVEANEELCREIDKNDRNIVCTLISDKIGEEKEYIFMNNSQSNSMLELEEHKKEHSWVYEIGRVKKCTDTIDNLFLREIKEKGINTLYMDIQGAELLALKGAEKSLDYIDIIYTEVNIKKLYKDCALIEDIDNFLFPRGFKRIITEINEHGWGDAVYLRI